MFTFACWQNISHQPVDASQLSLVPGKWVSIRCNMLKANVTYWFDKRVDTMTKKFFRVSVLAFFFPVISLPSPAQSTAVLLDSLQKADELLSFYPDSIDLRLRKAGWYLELERWESAKSEYDKILRKAPENVAGLYYRAYANERLGRYDFARLDYNHLLRIVPGNFHGLLGLALLNQKDHHFTEAMDMMNSLVEQYPGKALPYAARGGMEKERGMLEVAEYDFTEALLRDDGNTDYLLNRAEIRIAMGKKSEAADDLDRLVALGFSRHQLKDLYRQCRK